MKSSALAGMPLAAVLVDPLLVSAAAAQTQMVSIDTPSGRTVSGALALPVVRPAPAVLLIHEWWGLNDQIRTMATEFAKEGYIALACDLYGGAVAAAGDREQAKSLMSAVVETEATETVSAWVQWLSDHDKSTKKVGTIGWCLGGGWSLNTAIATPVDASIVYYGRVNKTVDQLSSIKGPVQGHFATQDQWINKDMVESFEAAMDKAGKAYETYWYEAGHAFANPSGGRYDKEDAAAAWKRTVKFFETNLG